MKANSLLGMLSTSLMCFSLATHAATTVTIGTVNNGDMIRMQKLSAEFEKDNPDIKLKWVILEENVLRQRLTTDIATKGGQFDVMTIGMYETDIWAKSGWLAPMENLSAEYDVADIFPAVRNGLSINGTLYALPFSSESSMTYYRTDLFAAAGLSMPPDPTWSQLNSFAKALNKPDQEQYGICLRGKAGWGENMPIITSMANTFGARWFDEQWKPEFTGKAWTDAVTYYVDTLGTYGPPGASSNGFNENLALFNSGKCAIWVDSTVAGSFVTDPAQSKVSDQVGFAMAPRQLTDKGSTWLWSWALAVPSSSLSKEAAKEFVIWATSKKYSQLVAEKYGIAAMPPGNRVSTYSNEAYIKAAPFANITLASLNKADPDHATLKPTPYRGIQIVPIREYQSIGTQVGKLISSALTGHTTVEQAMRSAQSMTEREMLRAGYK